MEGDVEMGLFRLINIKGVNTSLHFVLALVRPEEVSVLNRTRSDHTSATRTEPLY